MAHIDFKKRREDHTRRALDAIKDLPVSPVLLEIQYPQNVVWANQPPAFYIQREGMTLPVTRKEASFFTMSKVIYLPNGEVIYQWTK